MAQLQDSTTGVCAVQNVTPQDVSLHLSQITHPGHHALNQYINGLKLSVVRLCVSH